MPLQLVTSLYKNEWNKTVLICYWSAQCLESSGFPERRFTSFGIHIVHGANEQGGIWLCVFHEHQQELQRSLHHQTELHIKREAQLILNKNSPQVLSQCPVLADLIRACQEIVLVYDALKPE